MAAFDIKGALAGKWKATEVDKGAMEAFLKVKAVPMLIAKALTLFATSGTFELKTARGARVPTRVSPTAARPPTAARRDDKFVKTELGMFTNTEYPAVALDGAALTDHKNPAGEPIKMKGAIDGDKLVITSLEGTFDGTAGVTETYAMDGETLVLTIADIATGTSFTEKRSKV